MNSEHAEKNPGSPCVSSNECLIKSMLCEFYNKKMLSIVIIVWVYALAFIALAIFSGVMFFRAEQTRDHIMYAVLFICGIQFMMVIKIFAWQMIHRMSIKRDIKKLELHIAELSETVKK